MDYHQFINTLEEKVKASVQEHTSVNVHTTIKNNAKERKGLIIMERGVNISPTIYLEEYYEQFLRGKSIESILLSILTMYESVRFKHSWEVEYVKQFSEIKDKIVFKLINYEKNQSLLEETPYTRNLDLAIVFYVLLELNEQGAATMLIRNSHLEMWNVDLKDIESIAKMNIEVLLPFEFKPMQEVICDIMHVKEERTDVNKAGDYMYVLSNTSHNLGASCIMYDGMLAWIGECLKENYYILPSSVHEVIIVPESKSPTKMELQDIIKEINETQVDEEEVLSNFAYYYSLKGKRLLY